MTLSYKFDARKAAVNLPLNEISSPTSASSRRLVERCRINHCLAFNISARKGSARAAEKKPDRRVHCRVVGNQFGGRERLFCGRSFHPTFDGAVRRSIAITGRHRDSIPFGRDCAERRPSMTITVVGSYAPWSINRRSAKITNPSVQPTFRIKGQWVVCIRFEIVSSVRKEHPRERLDR